MDMDIDIDIDMEGQRHFSQVLLEFFKLKIKWNQFIFVEGRPMNKENKSKQCCKVKLRSNTFQ